MATRVDIQKITRQHAVVKAVAVTGGYANVDLGNLKYNDQTFDAANAKVDINGVYFCIDGSNHTHVYRNNNTVLLLNGSDNWNFSSSTGFAVNDYNSANISIFFGTGTNSSNGTVILSLSKTAGYIDPDRQILQQPDR